MTATPDLHRLDGANVLVKQTQQSLPGSPVAVRGVLRVTDEGQPPAPAVEIVLTHPAMFSTPAFEQAIPLDEDDLAALLASEHDGAYTFVYHGALDASVPRWPVANVIPAQDAGSPHGDTRAPPAGEFHPGSQRNAPRA
ncbi:MAG TPA: hypothetical protein VGD81_21180 [Opitutaceae bacterium]